MTLIGKFVTRPGTLLPSGFVLDFQAGKYMPRRGSSYSSCSKKEVRIINVVRPTKGY